MYACHSEPSWSEPARHAKQSDRVFCTFKACRCAHDANKGGRCHMLVLIASLRLSVAPLGPDTEPPQGRHG